VPRSLLLLNGSLPDGSRADLTISDGCIASVSPASVVTFDAPGVSSPRFAASLQEGTASELAAIDLEGRLVLPALVNGHAHLDKTFAGSPWQPHRPGATVRERVAAERAIRDELTDSVAERASALAAAMIEFGTGTVRTHVDIDTAVGLSSLDALLELREELRDVLRVQIVAFPQSGILASPGVGRLLAEALAAGADVVGGARPGGVRRRCRTPPRDRVRVGGRPRRRCRHPSARSG